MAKSDLLKEAIADAKAVKETALANAKIALQEAFQPRIKSMLETELMSELEDDEMGMEEPMGDEMGMEDEMGDEMDAMGDEMDAMGDEGEPMDVGDIEIDTDMDGEIDFTGDIMSKPGMDADMEDDMGMEGGIEDDEVGDMGAGDDIGDEDDLDLQEIIAELEAGLQEDSEFDEGMHKDEVEVEEMYEMDDPKAYDSEGDNLQESQQSIDELIEAILAEDEDEEKEDENDEKTEKDKTINASQYEGVKKDLEEAYNTVGQLKSVINEVNLLNAKLLYTNKLFRNFDLNEGQKMKVIENFDRAANTREAKLVFSTLAESFHKPSAGKKIVKESKSLASRPVATTAPSKATTQVLTEGFEQANRWKKLAGLIK